MPDSMVTSMFSAFDKKQLPTIKKRFEKHQCYTFPPNSKKFSVTSISMRRCHFDKEYQIGLMFNEDLIN